MRINNLPNEVLLCVLEEYCLHDQLLDPFQRQYDALHLRNPVWVASQVCRTWRHLVQTSLARAWGYVTLKDSMEKLEAHDTDELLPCNCNELRLDWAFYRIYKQIMLSCDSPLYIAVHGPESHPDILERIMSLFNPHYRRWRSFELHAFSFAETMPLNQTPGYDPNPEFPMLEHLALKIEGEGEEDTYPTLEGTFPRLKSLVINEEGLSVPSPTDITDGRIPWSQLEELEYNVENEERLNAILPLLTSVQILRLGSQSLPSDTSEAEGPLIELPLVKTLDITYSGWIPPLQRLVLPKLTRLVFSSRDEMPVTIESYITSQIHAITTRSKCTITELEISHFWARKIQDVKNLLRTMPSLKSLKISIPNPLSKSPVEAIITSMALGFSKPIGNTTKTLNGIISALRVGEAAQTPNYPPANLCMRLKHLSLTIPYRSQVEKEFENLPLDALLSVIMRRKKLAKLRSVEVNFLNSEIWSPWSYKQMVMLKKLGFNGMRVAGSWYGVEFDDIRMYSGGVLYALRYRFLFPALLACQAGMAMYAKVGSQ